MPTPAEDLNEKLRLERKLTPKMEAYNRRIISEFRSNYLRGDNFNVFAFNEELSGILADHWHETGAIFGNRIGPTLPDDIAKTEGEQKVIEEALLLWFFLKVPAHAKEINATTQENVAAAISEAEDDVIVRELQGREARRTAVAIASVSLSRKLRGRLPGIVTTETQIPAETAKATEAQVLIGQPPRISGGSRQVTELMKEWVSVGDSRVRDAHLSADGQRRPENEPFDVGGEQLRYPGDDSLGATAGNIINCRCSVKYDEEEIVDYRRG